MHMKKKNGVWLFCLMVVVQGCIVYTPLLGSIFEDVYEDIKGGVEDLGDYAKGVWKDGKKYLGEAGKAGYYVGYQIKDAGGQVLEYVNKAGKWVMTEAGVAARKAQLDKVADLVKRGVNIGVGGLRGIYRITTCLGKTSITLAQSLAGRGAPSFDEVTVEGTLGGATLGVAAKGSYGGKSFDLSLSVGKDGFTQEGFMKLFYDPFAKLF